MSSSVDASILITLADILFPFFTTEVDSFPSAEPFLSSPVHVQ